MLHRCICVLANDSFKAEKKKLIKVHFLFVAAFSVCFIFQIKITLPVIRVLSQTNDQLSSLHHSIPINDEEVK